MGRRNTRWTSNVYEIFLIGEQLRKQVHEQGLVKDRRHHLRKHKKCFTGRDLVDWLLKMHHVQSRDEAVSAMNILKQHGVFHHITDEHEFKDQNSFYRFSFDDDTYKLKPDLASFYWGLDIYRKLKDDNDDVIQEFYLRGSLYSRAFLGCDLVDFLVVSEGHENREEVVARLRDLLERDIIKHVTDDYHFNDDKLIYEFNLDFDKAYLLQDVMELVAQQRQEGEVEQEPGSPATGSRISESEIDNPAITKGGITPTDDNSLDADVTQTISYPRSRQMSERKAERSPDSSQQEPVPFPTIKFSAESLDSQFSTVCVQIERDLMGFGFVLRGSSPCYVHTVDPLGPAAAAGLKVRHFLSTVNDHNVLTLSHQEVGLLLTQTHQITLTVLSYRGVARAVNGLNADSLNQPFIR